MTDIVKLTQANAARWSGMAVHPELVGTITLTAQRLLKGKARFQAMSARTGVPWAVIAVIKEREAGPDELWTRSIAQGDPWNRVSTHVPSGRGPFNSWEEAAYDALMNCAPYAGRNVDWSIGGALTLLERYNGLGYFNKGIKGIPSPYIWASTNQYKSGKYIRDGVFDPNAIDKQIGCAALLKCLFAMDSAAVFGQGATSPAKPTPTPAQPAQVGGLLNAILSLIASIFRK